MFEELNKEAEMLERHLQVLQIVLREDPIGIVRIADETGYPHHKIRYSLRVLEEESFIEPTKQGATTTQEAETFVETFDGSIDDLQKNLESTKIEEDSAIEA